MITAPFNFVPLSEKVFFPDWAEKVSHDIPFEDSQSGVIDITLTAKSPIFVRDHDKQEEFCQHNGEYYIPSSSVKGMIRSVLEIMSFSKMNEDSYNDDTYAVRDLSSASNFYMTEMKENVLCGWLYKDGDDYMIEDCGEAYRISHQEIDKALDVNFSSKFIRSGFEKTSEYKYNLIGGTHKKVKVGEPYKSKTNAKYDKRLFCRYDSSGKTGTLVLTGQPTVRKNTGKMGDGKGFEFVFMDNDKSKNIKVDKEVFENFLFAYFDKRTTEPKESLDWKYWKNKLKNGEKVAVFFKKKANGVAHFGLSYLYKLPYEDSVSGGIPKIHTDNRKDLAQTMFGYIGKDEALKGRVQFSHFKAVKNIKISNSVTEVLGTPRASYYPMYVKQESRKLFTTFMDNGFNISGRKRYPIHKGIKSYFLPTNKDGKVNENIGTTFSPLKEGVLFEGKVRYHNLKKSELGALLSALTFHNTKECFHNIGMAKSLGYGKVELKINGIELNEYLKVFETEVTSSISNWAKSEQLTELLTMATEQDNKESSELRYMELKEFAKHKSRDKDYLRNYTALDNIKTVMVESLISVADLEELRILQEERNKEEKVRQEQEAIELKLRQEKEKQEIAFNNELKIVNDELEKDEVNLQILQNFIEKHPNYEKIEEIKIKKETIEKTKKDNKHKEVNEKADRAYEALEKKKGNQKQYLKEKDKFVKKWSKDKENKGSEYILELVKKLK